MLCFTVHLFSLAKILSIVLGVHTLCCCRRIIFFLLTCLPLLNSDSFLTGWKREKEKKKISTPFPSSALFSFRCSILAKLKVA